ncbi:MAG: hypothetical protein IJ801_08560, partial [Lachnospiraceae bacterium]|nr:hypothetical protein [Lachnospiraceae bacterium]
MAFLVAVGSVSVQANVFALTDDGTENPPAASEQDTEQPDGFQSRPLVESLTGMVIALLVCRFVEIARKATSY